MKTATIYIADDGTKFINKESCIKYEKVFMNNPNPGLVLLDGNGSLIPLEKYNSAIWINIIDPEIVKLRLESVHVEDNFPYVTDIPMEKGYYSYNGNKWDREDKSVYNFCSGMNTDNSLWYNLIQILLEIHESDNGMLVKVNDVDGNLIYDKMSVKEAMRICINDSKNIYRRIVWCKEIEDVTYVIIH